MRDNDDIQPEDAQNPADVGHSDIPLALNRNVRVVKRTRCGTGSHYLGYRFLTPLHDSLLPSPSVSPSSASASVSASGATKLRRPFASFVRSRHVAASTLMQECLSVVADFTHAGRCSPPAAGHCRLSLKPLLALAAAGRSVLASASVAARLPLVGPRLPPVAARLPTGLFCIGKNLPPIVLIDELIPHCVFFGVVCLISSIRRVC
ncbi:hypothetical protein Scep_019729 [Stephania cephalantha]|uniref:Uncharacterized protein n=1 Tax=Stephania cephalantha TaxID=152367 RepID=A0AAP0NNL0_9MAGN